MSGCFSWGRVFKMALVIYGKMVFLHGKAEPARDIELACQGPEYKCCPDGLHRTITVFKTAIHDRGNSTFCSNPSCKPDNCFSRDTGYLLNDFGPEMLDIT